MSDDHESPFEVLAPGEVPADYIYPGYVPDEYDLQQFAERGWTVRLPPQCGHWEITDSPYYETAIYELEQFIEDAQAALVALQARKP